MKFLIFPTMLFFLLVGCASLPGKGYSISTTFNNPPDGSYVVHTLTLLATEEDEVHLNKFCFKSGLTYYTLTEFYTGSDWRYMNSFSASIDGKEYKFDDANPRRTVGTGYVFEQVSSEVDETFVYKLVKSKTVRFQFSGSPISLPQSTMDTMKEAIQKLVSLTYEDHKE